MHIRRKPKHESGIKCVIHKTYSLDCDDYEALWARSGASARHAATSQTAASADSSSTTITSTETRPSVD